MVDEAMEGVFMYPNIDAIVNKFNQVTGGCLVLRLRQFSYIVPVAVLWLFFGCSFGKTVITPHCGPR